MAGFRNETLYAENVDFSGGDPIVGKVVADGQLLIGSAVAPNIRVGTLASSGGSVVITNSAGGINLEAGAAVPTTFTADSGNATPAVNNINFLGGSNGIDTVAAGSTVTLNFDVTEQPAIPTSISTDSGTVTPALNSFTIVGGEGIDVSGATSIVTVAGEDASDTNKGIASFDSGDFTVTAGNVVLNGSGVGQTLTGDTGGALSPTAGNWNILGGSNGIDVAGSGSTLTINFDSSEVPTLATSYTCNSGSAVPALNVLQVLGVGETSTSGATNVVSILSPRTAKYVVDATLNNGTHQTIAAALAAASSGETIFIRPGTFTEDLSLKAGVDLVAYDADANTPNVTIVGNATASFAGTCSISGIRLQTNAAAFLTVSGSDATIVNLHNCFLNASNATGISYSSSSSSSRINCFYCRGNLGTTGIAMYSSSSAGTLFFQYCSLLNTGVSTTVSTNSAGTVNYNYTEINFAISNSSTAATGGYNSRFDCGAINTTAIAIASTTQCNFQSCFIGSGTVAALTSASGSTVTLSQCIINSSNSTEVISGLGTVQYRGVAFDDKAVITATTQTPGIYSNNAVQIKAPAAYPYTTVPQDAVILVDTSSARTITPLASPTTGQVHRIKDNVGSAGTNNITITPSGKNIDGAASYTITVNYGAVDIVYNGTEWSVL